MKIQALLSSLTADPREPDLKRGRYVSLRRRRTVGVQACCIVSTQLCAVISRSSRKSSKSSAKQCVMSAKCAAKSFTGYLLMWPEVELGLPILTKYVRQSVFLKSQTCPSSDVICSFTRPCLGGAV
jgi:hypothetical protein